MSESKTFSNQGPEDTPKDTDISVSVLVFGARGLTKAIRKPDGNIYNLDGTIYGNDPHPLTEKDVKELTESREAPDR